MAYIVSLRVICSSPWGTVNLLPYTLRIAWLESQRPPVPMDSRIPTSDHSNACLLSLMSKRLR
jgi:hypothetical protein